MPLTLTGALRRLAVAVWALLTVSAAWSTFDQDYSRALKLNQQVESLYKAGRFREAIPLAQEQLALAEKLFGPRHALTAASVHNLAGLYRDGGDYPKAAALFERSLKLSEEIYGPDHLSTAEDLDALASVHLLDAAFDRAEPLALRALAIREKAVGPKSLPVAESLQSLGRLYEGAGRRAEAESAYRRSLALRERALGENDRLTADSLEDLAGLLLDDGHPERAEPLTRRALAISRKVLGERHPATATSQTNLGAILWALGAYPQADALFMQALPVLEEALGVDDPSTLSHRRYLGRRRLATGDYERAEPMLQSVLAGREQRLGPNHPETADSLDDLAEVYRGRGEPARARPLFERALAIREKLFGPQARRTVQSLSALAAVASDEGDYTLAERYAQRALAGAERAFGSMHPDTATTLTNLAMLAWGRGSLGEAQRMLRRAFEIDDDNAARAMALGDEASKTAYAGTLQHSTDIGLSLAMAAVRARVPQAADFGLELLLQRKGRVLDVMADRLAAQRVEPAQREALERWRAAAARVAALSLGQAPRRTALDDADAELAAAETQLVQRNPVAAARVDVAGVRRALPPGAVLVEWLRYQPMQPRAAAGQPRSEAPRYAAFVLRAEGEPVALDVGEAAPIDTGVSDLLAALRDRSPLWAVLARELDARLWQPLAGQLRDDERLLIAPDGPLHLLPFAVLADAAGRLLIERRELSYLTSGRDLLRTPPPAGWTAGAASAALVLAAPDFGPVEGGAATALTAPIAQRSAMVERRFLPLPGTLREAKALLDVLRAENVQVLTGAAASKTALRAAHGPRLLHVATHGFFLPDVEALRERPVYRTTANPEQPLVGPANPLLRSGLALAGANRLQSGADDGILTALEVAGLDLQGTELAVLSACDTGLGQVRNGEGVYGLRRALLLAGARSQVVSLWQVDDMATSALMVDFYRRLVGGEGRAAALRSAQLAQLHVAGREHPYFWAAFVSIGDTGPLLRP